MRYTIAVIGAGLSGSECAYTLAKYLPVTLFEMRPKKYSPAHTTPYCAELVCSNSLRAEGSSNAVGLLKQEMLQLDSIIMRQALKHKIPAGKALAVERDAFAQSITHILRSHPNITYIEREINTFAELLNTGFTHIILATGPLTSDALSADLARIIGQEYLYFYDAIAPIIHTDSVDMTHAFWASRYATEESTKDYLNCPLTEEEYTIFYNALLSGNTVPTHNAEKNIHFEGCMPIESLAERGFKTLLFGPFKPTGLYYPNTNKRPFAVLQLRLEDHNKTACNLVGCQTRLTYQEQRRIFRLIPALRDAEFVRYGSVHRNTYLHSPTILTKECALKQNSALFCIGQITGVEGYLESAATGLWLGHYLGALLSKNYMLPHMPETCILGSLLAHLQRDNTHFQPSNATFGLTPEPPHTIRNKTQRKEYYAQRAVQDFSSWLTTQRHILHLQ